MFHQGLSNAKRIILYAMTIIALLSMSLGGASTVKAVSGSNSQTGTFAIVFVSRKIPPQGSVYYSSGGSLPGVGAYSRFQVGAPGKLIVREANGTLRTLVDGSTPTTTSLNLIDVNAPNVSYDGTKIVFAGLPAGSYSTSPMNNPGAWRIYMINADGTGLRQVTFSDRNINLSQFGNVASNFTTYDDTDPAWLPDGRIVLSSTRWPSFAQYSGARTSNLYVVNADGSNLHRITAERNGADRPVIDPLTGRIIYSRWWRNFRYGTDDMATVSAPGGGYKIKDGLCAHTPQGDICQEVGGKSSLDRNAWHLASINPDGTGLMQFAGRSNTFVVGEIINHAYGGSFALDGSFYANFFPMTDGTEAAGFGGIRRYQRGPNGYTSIIGITTRDEIIQQFVRTNPNSYGVYVGNYAAEPEVLPDGRLLISWAQDTAQDYGLYIINSDGSNLTKLYDNTGTTELRARLLRPRSVPPIIADKVTRVASSLPPLAQGPYDIDGTFTFRALNVYFNAPVDVDIMSAIPVGSANSIRFYIDHQRSENSGSFMTLDWPILLQEVLISPDGSVTANAPANVPLFEQIRSKQPEYKIPQTGRGYSSGELVGAAHVAGLNFGRTGDVATCVGCHAGHTLIPVPANPADAQWTNLAPGAVVTYSSLSTNLPNGDGLVDRRVKLRPSNDNFWLSRSGLAPNTQWVQMTFPVPVTVRTVRLYNIPSSDSSIKVMESTVRLYSDAAGSVEVANNKSGQLSENGTNVSFNEVFARVVRIEFNSVNGSNAGLAEVEVIARAEASNATGGPTATAGPTETPSLTPTATETASGSLTASPTPIFSSSPTSTLTLPNTMTATQIPSNTHVASSSPTSTPALSNTMTATQIASNTPVSSPTSAFTPTDTSIPAWTPTNTILPSLTNTPLATFTQTATQIAPTLPHNSNPLTLLPASINAKDGTYTGIVQSLGSLQQDGNKDDPKAYVLFQPKTDPYQGYQSFYLPKDVNPASILEATLQVNYKGYTTTRRQIWTWAVYDWGGSKWVTLGTIKSGTSEEWKKLLLSLRSPKRFISPEGELRIQLWSNRASGDLKVDYEVIHVKFGAEVPPLVPAIPTGTLGLPVILPTVTYTSTPQGSPTHSP